MNEQGLGRAAQVAKHRQGLMQGLMVNSPTHSEPQLREVAGEAPLPWGKLEPQ